MFLFVEDPCWRLRGASRLYYRPKIKNSHGGKIDDIFFGKRSPPPQTETGSFVMTAHGSALTVLPMSIRNQRRKIFGRRPMSKSNRKDSIWIRENLMPKRTVSLQRRGREIETVADVVHVILPSSGRARGAGAWCEKPCKRPRDPPTLDDQSLSRRIRRV